MPRKSAPSKPPESPQDRSAPSGGPTLPANGEASPQGKPGGKKRDRVPRGTAAEEPAALSGSLKPSELQVEWVAIQSIKPYDRNPRKNADAIQAVIGSLHQFGWQQPIVVDRRGVIVAGHTRWAAAQRLGMAEVPIVRAMKLTETEARAYRLADNQTNTLSGWDSNLLREELAALKMADFDMATMGFTTNDIDRMLRAEMNLGLTDPDSVPAPPDEPVTRPGDIWQLGRHRLMCGDSGNPSHLDALLAGAKVHLVNTDPPYNVNVEPRSNNAIAAGNSSFQGTPARTHHQGLDLARHPGKAKPTSQMRHKDRPLANDFMTDEAFAEMLLAWFGNIARVLVPGGTFYIWGGYANCGNYPPALKACQLYFAQAVIWVKEHPVMTRKDFMGNHEWAFYGWREGAGHRFFGRRNVPDTWFGMEKAPPTRGSGDVVEIGEGVRIMTDGGAVDVLPATGDHKHSVELGDGVVIRSSDGSPDVWRVKKVPGVKMVHLTEKPVELATRAMNYSSLPGENVLDLFGGSGSTMIAAEMAGRCAYLMEMDMPYCDVIVARYEAFSGKKAKLVTKGAPAKAPLPPLQEVKKPKKGKQA